MRMKMQLNTVHSTDCVLDTRHHVSHGTAIFWVNFQTRSVFEGSCLIYQTILSEKSLNRPHTQPLPSPSDRITVLQTIQHGVYISPQCSWLNDRVASLRRSSENPRPLDLSSPANMFAQIPGWHEYFRWTLHVFLQTLLYLLRLRCVCNGKFKYSSGSNARCNRWGRTRPVFLSV